ncbi:uncharacterized protein LOC143037028 [Oratosquilla oratoria]|uniref:uncharacterized protein LOC143037028 n=1 Tax=Oratosquilla oratoria TaxID=337810 RepID=UPI003F759321
MEKRVTASLVDEIISTEIPDPGKEPRLHDIITRNMIHGPCKGFNEQQPCCQGKNSKGDTCGKGFPKVCREELLFGNNGYPLYKRRSIGQRGNSIVKKVKGKDVTIENSWVVPYNAYLCLFFDAHINVECANTIKYIAYVTKYLNKGCDRILYTKEGEEMVNEVKNYQEACFINANEATWKIFRFLIHKNSPAVLSLDLHLEGENEVFYKDSDSTESLNKKSNIDTQLTAFFQLCTQNKFAAELYYHQVPNHFLWDKKLNIWRERKTYRTTLGRIRAFNTKTVELFYMRLLLMHIKGPTSFEALRTHEGRRYDTYRETVKAMGLINDEETWQQTILEIINHTNDQKKLSETYANVPVEPEQQSRVVTEHSDDAAIAEEPDQSMDQPVQRV